MPLWIAERRRLVARLSRQANRLASSIPLRRRPAQRQSGAMPYRIEDGELLLMLVTSRRTRRWIFPKGGLNDGKTPAQSAAQEAYEEAGVEGRVELSPLGRCAMVKRRPFTATPLVVEMFPLRVDRVLDDWPEMHQRERLWADLDEVRARVADPQLVRLAESLADREAAALDAA